MDEIFGRIISGTAFDDLTTEQKLERAVEILIIFARVENWRLLNSPANVITKPGEVPSDLSFTWYDLIAEVGRVIQTSLSIKGINTATYEGSTLRGSITQPLVANEYNATTQYNQGSQVYINDINYISKKTVIDASLNQTPGTAEGADQWEALPVHIWEAAFLSPSEEDMRNNSGSLLLATTESRTDTSGTDVDVGAMGFSNIKVANPSASTMDRQPVLRVEYEADGVTPTGSYILEFEPIASPTTLPTLGENELLVGDSSDFVRGTGIALDPLTLPDASMSSTTVPQLVTDGAGGRSLVFQSSSVNLGLPTITQNVIPVSDGTGNIQSSGLALDPATVPSASNVKKVVCVTTNACGDASVAFEDNTEFNLPEPAMGDADRVVKINSEGGDYALGARLTDIDGSNVVNQIAVITDVTEQRIGYKTLADLGVSGTCSTGMGTGTGTTLPTIPDNNVVLGDGAGNIKDSAVTFADRIPTDDMQYILYLQRNSGDATKATITFGAAPMTSTGGGTTLPTIANDNITLGDGMGNIKDSGIKFTDRIPPDTSGTYTLYITRNTDSTATLTVGEVMTQSGTMLPNIPDNNIVLGDGSSSIKDSTVNWDLDMLPTETSNIQVTVSGSGMSITREISYTPAIPVPTNSEGNYLLTANSSGNGYALQSASDLGLTGGGTPSTGAATPYFYGYRDEENDFVIIKNNRVAGDTVESYDVDNFDGYCHEYTDMTFDRDPTDPRKLRSMIADNYNVTVGLLGFYLHENYNAWDASTTYATDDRVLHNKLLWSAETGNTGSTPDLSNTDWRAINFYYGEIVFLDGTSYVSTADDNEDPIGTGSDWNLYIRGPGENEVSNLLTGTPAGSIITTNANSEPTTQAKGSTDSTLTYRSASTNGVEYRSASAIGDEHGVDDSIKPFAFLDKNYVYMNSGDFLCTSGAARLIPSGCLDGDAPSSPTGKNRFKQILSFKSGVRNAVLALDYNGVAYLCENGDVVRNVNLAIRDIESSMYGGDHLKGSYSLDLRPISWFIDNNHTIKDIAMNYYDYHTPNNSQNTVNNNTATLTNITFSSRNSHTTFGICYWFITENNHLYRLGRGDTGPINGSGNINDKTTDTTPHQVLNGSAAATSASEFIHDQELVGSSIWFKTTETTGNPYRSIGYEGAFRNSSIFSPSGLPDYSADPIVKIVSANKYRTLRFSRDIFILNNINRRVFTHGSYQAVNRFNSESVSLSIALTESGNCYYCGAFPLLGGDIAQSVDNEGQVFQYTTRTSSFTLISRADHFDNRLIEDVQISSAHFTPTVMFLAKDSLNDSGGYLYTAGIPARSADGEFVSGVTIASFAFEGGVFLNAIGRDTFDMGSLSYLSPGLALVSDYDGNDLQGTINEISADNFLGLWTGSDSFAGYERLQIDSIRTFVETGLIRTTNNEVCIPNSVQMFNATQPQGQFLFSANIAFHRPLCIYTRIPLFDGPELDGYKPIQGLENKPIKSIGYAGPHKPLVIYDDGTASIGNAYAVNADSIGTGSTDQNYAIGQAHDDLFNIAEGEPGLFKLRPLRIL